MPLVNLSPDAHAALVAYASAIDEQMAGPYELTEALNQLRAPIPGAPTAPMLDKHGRLILPGMWVRSKVYEDPYKVMEIGVKHKYIRLALYVGEDAICTRLTTAAVCEIVPEPDAAEGGES